MNVGIVGVTGYSGQTLFRLLAAHPAVDQVNLYGHVDEGNGPVRYLDEEVPMFFGHHLPLEPFDAATMMAANDAVFFATSAGVTSQLAGPFIEADFPVIDLSGDYRLQDPEAYAQWYHKTPASQLNAASYQLADLGAPQTHYVANPGCYATATLLGLAPLVQHNLVQPDSIIVDAKSGTSGAGKKLSPLTHFTEANDNLQVYKLNAHQHIPEIVQQLKQWDPAIESIQFNTTLLPITTGIMATIYAKGVPGLTEASVVDAFQATYQDHPFIQLMPGQMPDIKMVIGTNNCALGISFNDVTNTIMVVSVIDNLVKGAAGQAVQNFNDLFQLTETAGLPTLPVLA
ncbi:N-acetyl-gamma-glutamyl-phosphate reductase [Secundilactobacillus kimchicus]|uniref:N-acetyl-gamma-glutamyl-phosphate reductase n=1 Tax=Secundilactobacillus kimchicus TaxID=528209 RepID=UPI001C016C07|nr:N-acetyl-gamma-glutamyl-phosphate reductase [Secundilactobacillus kimchicus]MBT9672285.1 N-acetyl-gamma-glutamyl-phosphate reductase [Secundilactobacillus kimchicus]